MADNRGLLLLLINSIIRKNKPKSELGIESSDFNTGGEKMPEKKTDTNLYMTLISALLNSAQKGIQQGVDYARPYVNQGMDYMRQVMPQGGLMSLMSPKPQVAQVQQAPQVAPQAVPNFAPQPQAQPMLQRTIPPAIQDQIMYKRYLESAIAQGQNPLSIQQWQSMRSQ